MIEIVLYIINVILILFIAFIIKRYKKINKNRKNKKYRKEVIKSIFVIIMIIIINFIFIRYIPKFLKDTTVSNTIDDRLLELPLDEKSGITKNKYSNMNYYVYIPENAKGNMPLIIYLHGDDYVYSIDKLRNKGIYQYVNNIYGNNYPFILIQPHTNIESWIKGDIPSNLKKVIDFEKDRLKVNLDKIILIGHSRGAMGAWYIANKYSSLFSCVVPISGDEKINAKNYINLPVRAYSSVDSSDSWNYGNMKKNVELINKAGGNANFISVKNYTHANILNGVIKKELFDWMISNNR